MGKQFNVKPTKFIDLHTHTTASDGTLTPTELIDYAIKKGLSAIAITDHDTIVGVVEARKYMTENNLQDLELISGIEFSTTSSELKTDIHILGLYIDENNTVFLDSLDEIIKERTIRNNLMVKKLNELGLDLTIEEVNQSATDLVVTRAHFAKLLLEKGFVKTWDEAFKKYIGYGCKAYIRREKLHPYQAIEMILKCGGVPILAHPTLYGLKFRELDELLTKLVANGLKGIEGIYSLYTNAQERSIKDLAVKHGLVISGGSDYHGLNKSTIDLAFGRGNLFVPYEVLEQIKKVL